MSEIESIKNILAGALLMIDNVDKATFEKHRSMEYVEEAMGKLREVGFLVHSLTPNLTDMIQFVQEYVPEQYHGNVNHAWSGIGDWVA